MVRGTPRESTVPGWDAAPPYSTAGTAPSRRSRLAICLPVPSRRLMTSSCISILYLLRGRSERPNNVSDEQRRDRLFVVNPADRFAQQWRHAQHGDPRLPLVVGNRDRVGDDQLL